MPPRESYTPKSDLPRFRKAHWEKSVVVRVVSADVHPLIVVPNYAGVRVVSGIVVGMSRRESACYERHKAPTSKTGHTKTPADGGGTNPEARCAIFRFR